MRLFCVPRNFLKKASPAALHVLLRLKTPLMRKRTAPELEEALRQRAQPLQVTGVSMKTATQIAKEVTPAATYCTHHSHYLLILDTDAERCPTCGRKLWRRSPQKCVRHEVWHCPDCFSEKDIQDLKRIRPEEDEDD